MWLVGAKMWVGLEQQMQHREQQMQQQEQQMQQQEQEQHTATGGACGCLMTFLAVLPHPIDYGGQCARNLSRFASGLVIDLIPLPLR